MSRILGALQAGVAAALALMAVEAVISIAAGWPHQFGGPGDPHQVLAEFPSNGTALAPPAFLIVALALVAVGLRRDDGWRTVALVALLPVAAVLTVGAAGETLAASTLDVPRAVQLVGGSINTLVSFALLILAVATLAAVRRGTKAATTR